MGSENSVSNVSKITLDEVKVVLNSLKEQRETISSVYNSEISTVLESSSSCLTVAGLDYSQIIDTFNSTFTKLDERYYALIDVLENNVIKNYDELVTVIRQMFNDTFAKQMEELLGLTSKDN